MVLVDTSIWISLFRKKGTSLGEQVWSLVADNQVAVCGQIFVEFVGGFRKSEIRKDYSLSFGQFPFIENRRADYVLAADFMGEYPRLGPGDALIAATAIQNNLSLLTLDKDFTVLIPKGLSLYLFKGRLS